jgi:Fe-S-cluster containining protein
VPHVDANPERAAQESALCQTCGLCCEGQLFGWVELRPEEVERAKAWPVGVTTKGGEVGFEQPCACFQRMRCTVYAQRPKACVDYRCMLLKRVEKGEITPAFAQARIDEARGLFDEIQRRLPANDRKRIWDRVDDHWDLERLKALVEGGELDPSTAMSIVALDVVLTKHFRSPKPPKGSPPPAAP